MILFLCFCQKFYINRRPASQQICGMTPSEKLNGWLAGGMCGINLKLELYIHTLICCVKVTFRRIKVQKVENILLDALNYR